MNKFKISKFVFEIIVENVRSNGYIALYHSLTMAVIYIRECVYTNLKDDIENNMLLSCNNIIENLMTKKFIVPTDINEDEEILTIAESLNVMRPTTLRLQLTDACNLQCEYCQIERNYKDNKNIHMSEDIILRSLQQFARFAPKGVQKSVILTGGEPLLNFQAIESLIKCIDKYIDSYRLILFTNGTQITEQLATFLKDNGVLVLVSLDGTEKQHNMLRRNVLNDGSFKEALNGYYICKKCGCRVGISGVINTHNVNELNPEIVNYFLNLEPDSLGLNFTHYLLYSDNTKILPMEEYTDAIIVAYKTFREHGIYLENINRIIEPFVMQKINGKECAALGRGITVLPNGIVGPCKTLLVAGKIGTHMEEIERLDNIEDDMTFSKWQKRSTYSLESCKRCIGLSLCGSGCTYDSFVANGQIDGIDKRTCIFIKKILNFLISDLYNIMEKNTVWDIIIPTPEDRQKIYHSVSLSENDLRRSAGHEI